MASILSPVGNWDGLCCAVNNGADSVYLGLNVFNARLKADNFTRQQLKEVVDYCHLFGVKIFVTINTSIKQNELPEAINLLHHIYNCNADGIIVTDLALLDYCGKTFGKKIEIVASTQLNIHDLCGAQYVESLGATTVVVARETPLADIQQILLHTSLRVECFIHGAMCVCQSGQCLMSSIIGGNSGNRGQCLQPCRQHYTAQIGGKVSASGYLLSTKDMCMLDDIKMLEQMGVAVFKIEGRNRRSQYSGLTTDIYHRALDNNLLNRDEALNELKTMYNRGNYMSTEYLYGANSDIIYNKAQGHIGIEIGRIVNKKLDSVRSINTGDAFKILRDGKEIGHAAVIADGNGHTSISFSCDVRDGDAVCITTDTQLVKRIDKVTRRLQVELLVDGKVNEPLQLTARYLDITATANSTLLCEKAVNIVKMKETLTQQLSKTGDTCFTISNIVFHCEDIFIPISQINMLRRQLMTQLQVMIINAYDMSLDRQYVCPPISTDCEPICDSDNVHRIIAVCTKLPTITNAIDNHRVDMVILACDDISSVDVVKLHTLSKVKPIFIDLPPFAGTSCLDSVVNDDNGVGIVCNNIGQLHWAQTNNVPYIGGSGLNIYNNFSANIVSKGKYNFFYSYELTLREIANLSNTLGFVYMYGDITVMRLIQCPYKACGYDCTNCHQGTMQYTDDKNNKFNIIKRKFDRCMFDVINGAKLYVANKSVNANNFVVEYNEGIVQYYYGINHNLASAIPQAPQQYTKGRLFEKVN